MWFGLVRCVFICRVVSLSRIKGVHWGPDYVFCFYFGQFCMYACFSVSLWHVDFDIGTYSMSYDLVCCCGFTPVFFVFLMYLYRNYYYYVNVGMTCAACAEWCVLQCLYFFLDFCLRYPPNWNFWINIGETYSRRGRSVWWFCRRIVFGPTLRVSSCWPHLVCVILSVLFECVFCVTERQEFCDYWIISLLILNFSCFCAFLVLVWPSGLLGRFVTCFLSPSYIRSCWK